MVARESLRVAHEKLTFLGTIDNGLNLLRVPGIWKDVIAGLVLVVALIIDRVRERYR